jgi:hypothetical protein
MLVTVRIAFEEFTGRDPMTRDYSVGSLLVRAPDDDVSTLVSGGNRIVLAATDMRDADASMVRMRWSLFPARGELLAVEFVRRIECLCRAS